MQQAELGRFQPISDPRPTDEAWPEMIWPVPENAVLTGDTVQLTRLDPAADAAGLFEILDNDRVWAHAPRRPRDPHQFEDLLRERSSYPNWRGWTVRSLRPIGDRPAGTIIAITAYLDARPNDAGVEIGFTLYTPSVWGTEVNPRSEIASARVRLRHTRRGTGPAMCSGCPYRSRPASRYRARTAT